MIYKHLPQVVRLVYSGGPTPTPTINSLFRIPDVYRNPGNVDISNLSQEQLLLLGAVCLIALILLGGGYRIFRS